MKKNISLILWAFATVIFESVLNRYIGIGGVFPDLVFAFVICVAFLDNDMVRVTALAVSCGLVLDCIACGNVGVNMFGFGICAVLCNFFAEKFFVSNVFIAAVGMAVLSVISRLTVFVFSFAIFGRASLSQIFVPLILKCALYNLCISAIIYLILKNTVYKKKAYDRR